MEITKEILSNPHYPVNSLMEELLNTFTKLSHKYDLESSINNGLNKAIVMHLTDNPIHAVAELNSNNQIILYDNFCQFFWCLCYTSLTMYDKGIIKELIEGKFNGKIDISNDDLKIAYQVFQAGVGLLISKNSTEITNRYVFFELPNPFNCSNEYVEKANGIYCYGMSFILYHEFSHFSLDHSLYGAKEDEEEADENAFWSILMGAPKEEEITSIIGIITALCALIFLDDTLKGDEVHPDGDTRIKSIFEKIDSQYDHYFGIAVVCLKMWAFHYGFEKDFPQSDTCKNWKKYFELILKYLDLKKTDST
ncbi:phage exclusion protein Lit family protein [Sphingobacterium kitahiroshimense]|uniref:phage exclusion protein Lit family protein n=1 Tax=Sphingobacterium kitahiroshimense TaxID=470446 RepID=UPI00320A6A73